MKLTDVDIKKGNELITKFMGESQALNFHDEWNLIMPVWEKIMALEDKKVLTYTRVEIGKYSIFMEVYSYEKKKVVKGTHFVHSCFPFNEGLESDNMKDVYYKEIIDFINWYNTCNFETEFHAPNFTIGEKIANKIFDSMPKKLKELWNSI